MITENNINLIDELVALIKQYYPSGVSFDDPLYQSSIEYKRLREKQQAMIKDVAYLEFIEKNLKKIFSPYAVINWTYLEEYPDVEYHILLHKNQDIMDDDICLLEKLNWERRDFFLYISIIGKYYFYFIKKMKLVREKYHFSFDQLHNIEEKARVKSLEKLFSNEGYTFIDKNTANYIIENIETELSPMGTTTIFKCLFNDLWTIDKN